MCIQKNENDKNFPTKSELLLTFLHCISWEERYMYIIDLGKLLPKFPKNMHTQEFLLPGCQSHTWIAVTTTSFFSDVTQTSTHTYPIVLHGDSDSSIVKGIITIIFIIYQKLTLSEIIDFNAQPFLEKLQLQKNLTASRSQGIQAILDTIHVQAENLKNKILYNLY